MFPPATVLGATDTELRDAGFTVKLAETVFVPSEPVMVTVVGVLTPMVLIVNVPVVEPAATSTFNGTTAVPLDVVRLIPMPPVGAGPLRVTVPEV